MTHSLIFEVSVWSNIRYICSLFLYNYTCTNSSTHIFRRRCYVEACMCIYIRVLNIWGRTHLAVLGRNIWYFVSGDHWVYIIIILLYETQNSANEILVERRITAHNSGKKLDSKLVFMCSKNLNEIYYI